MSGDVQPKKRRDKRKKKEDQIEETVAHQHAVPTPTVPIDDTNIHVHKEKTIGGGLCAKCIFFIITIAIAIIIGLTITEHRGITDIDIPLSESRFASIFEGWIDTERNDDHDEGVESDEVSFDHDDDDDDDDDDEESHEEEEDEGVGSEEDESTEETEEAEQEDDEDTIESEEQESEEPEESPEQEESTEQDESPENASPESQEDKSEEQKSEEDEEEEVPQSQEESEEHPTPDDDDEPDQPESNEVDQETKDADEQEEIEDPQPDEVAAATTSGVAAKFGVGVALLIVAYVVLIKKWKSDKVEESTEKNAETESPNYSRRNTIIPPPTLEEVEQDMENVEEEYSEDEDVEESDEEIHIPTSKRQYEELRATYTRSLTPEAYVEQSKEQCGEYEDEEMEEEEEGEEEYDEEREDVEYNDDEDEELMKKLEEKYGRIANKGSKYEDEEDEEEDEDDEDYNSWKRVKGLGDNAAESESDDEPQRRSGAQSYDLDNITNAYDYEIREDLDYADYHLPNE